MELGAKPGHPCNWVQIHSTAHQLCDVSVPPPRVSVYPSVKRGCLPESLWEDDVNMLSI